MLSPAADLAPKGAFVEIAGAERGSYAVGAGLLWPWSLRADWLGGEVTGSTEAFAGHWNTRGWSGREGYSLIGVVPMLRYRFSQGRSPWFIEGGIGASFLDDRIETPNKRMGTPFNFYDALAVGVSVGANRRHELSLRATHLSNAGLKAPNPGENFLRLRYATWF